MGKVKRKIIVIISLLTIILIFIIIALSYRNFLGNEFTVVYTGSEENYYDSWFRYDYQVESDIMYEYNRGYDVLLEENFNYDKFNKKINGSDFDKDTLKYNMYIITESNEFVSLDLKSNIGEALVKGPAPINSEKVEFLRSIIRDNDANTEKYIQCEPFEDNNYIVASIYEDKELENYIIDLKNMEIKLKVPQKIQFKDFTNDTLVCSEYGNSILGYYIYDKTGKLVNRPLIYVEILSEESKLE